MNKLLISGELREVDHGRIIIPAASPFTKNLESGICTEWRLVLGDCLLRRRYWKAL